MYQYAKDCGITLLTITHRPTLWKFHTHILTYDGEGGWSFDELESGAEVGLREEKAALEAKLSATNTNRSRLAELCAELGETSALLT